MKTTKTSKSKKPVQNMYFCCRGRRVKMEIIPSGNYVARGMFFHEGENCFHFADSHDSLGSRLGYHGSKSVCTIHRFSLKADQNANILVNINKDVRLDVMLIPAKRGKFDFQIRFSKENLEMEMLKK